MEIVEHTSTQLILQDPAEKIWIPKLLSGIFLAWGSWVLFLVINDHYSLSFLIVIHIIFPLGLGGATAFFPWRNKVYFDRDTGKFKITSESVFRTKSVEYPLGEVRDVIVEKEYESEGISYALLAVKMADQPQPFCLSRENLILKNAEETAELIRNFLNISF